MDVMGDKFKLGDLVWAKMKGFSPWPGKIATPPAECKKPARKSQLCHCIYFFGTKDYAYVPDDCVWEYFQNKERYSKTNKKTVLEAIAEAEKYHLGVSSKPTDENSQANVPSVVKKETVMKSEDAIKTKKSMNNDKPEEKPKQALKKAGAKPRATVVPRSTPMGSAVSFAQGVKRKYGTGKVNGATFKRSIAVENKIAFDTTPTKKPKTSNSLAHYTIPKIQKAAKSAEPAMSSSPNAVVASPSSQPAVMSPSSSSTPPPDLQHSVDARLACMPSPSKVAALADSTINVGREIRHIGFIGLGTMGMGMAANMLRAGYKVTVWNRTQKKCEDLALVRPDGTLQIGDSPGDVMHRCDLVFSCVSDPHALREIFFNDDGIINYIKQGKRYVDMSTVDPETTININQAVEERGGLFLEAPVSGSKGAAEGGTLMICAAGSNALFHECKQHFSAIGKKAIFLGEVGNGAKMKLVLNMMIGTAMSSLAEGMSLAEKAGLCHQDVLEFLDMSALSCPLMRTKGKAIAEGNFPTSFLLKHQQKDIRLVIQLGDQLEHQLPLAAAANELYKRAKALGYGDNDMSAVYKAAYL